MKKWKIIYWGGRSDTSEGVFLAIEARIKNETLDQLLFKDSTRFIKIETLEGKEKVLQTDNIFSIDEL